MDNIRNTQVLKHFSIKSLLCFATIQFLALSFPIQVMTKSFWPALLPYVTMVILFFLPRKESAGFPIDLRRLSSIELIIGLYIGLVMLHIIWQVTLGFTSLYEGVRTAFVFITPVVFYCYFSRYASTREIHSVLLSMALAGIFSGLFFVFDSVMRLAFGVVTQYAEETVKYSEMRDPTFDSAYSSRGSAYGRSFGLLMTHTISGTWVAFGAFALLAIVPQKQKRLRLMIVIGFGLILLIGLNFTSIVAFTFIIAMVEFRFFSLVRGKVSPTILQNLFFILFAVISLVFLLNYFLNPKMIEYLRSSLISQVQFATIGRIPENDNTRESFADLVLQSGVKYWESIVAFPATLIIGDGFSAKFGMVKGGDFGYIETLTRFGIPMFLVIIFGLFRICYRVSSTIVKIPLKQGKTMINLLTFSLTIVLFVLVMEIHYSIWFDKSVLPIFFFALGLYSRIRVGLRTHAEYIF